MIVKQYILDFEKLGFGLFVHFGIFSDMACGEWNKRSNHVPDAVYEAHAKTFCPDPAWAMNLARTARETGCRYITLTTRHHDGYSLYDTKGLNTYDAPHSCGRDLVREFVDACRACGLVPFLYHTLLDWREPSYQKDFPAYLEYLRKSIEILCTNYGKIGGFWFDGMWDRKEDDWEEDKLYGLIRRYQPEAMIINNTGLSARGEPGHIELDSVTFERGKPQKRNQSGAPKYVASEMCEVFGSHWGYAKEDLNFKAPAQMIRELAECRRYGSNFLMNVGPRGDGSLRPIEAASLELLGQWMGYFAEAMYEPRPADIAVAESKSDFLLKNGKNYYYFCYDLPMVADPNVTLTQEQDYVRSFSLPEQIGSVTWLDNGTEVAFEQSADKVKLFTCPYTYGRDLVVRVAKIHCL